MKDIDITLP